MNRSWFLFSLLAVPLALLISCGDGSTRPGKAGTPGGAEGAHVSHGRLLARIGGEDLKEEDFTLYLKETLGENYRDFSDLIYSSLFDQYIEEVLFASYAEKQGFDAEPREREFYLNENGMDPKTTQWRGSLRRKYLIGKMTAKEVLPKIDVSEGEVRSFYNNNLELFRKPAEIQLSQIIVSEEKGALDVRALLGQEPGRFSELARTRSVGPEREKGGDMGFFSKGELPQEIENVVFTLNPGEISPIVKSPYGYHLFMVTKRKNKRLMALPYVADSIRLKLKQQKYKAQWQALKEELNRKVEHEIFPENLFFKYLPPQERSREDSPTSTVQEEGEKGGNP